MRNFVSVYIVYALIVFNLSHTFAQSKEEQTVFNLSKKKFNWQVNKQLDSLDAILDERALYIHSNGWAETKQEALDNLQSGKLVYKNIEIKEANVRLYSGTAIVTGKGSFSGTVNGTDFDIELSYTEVYVQKKNKWLLVSRHANRMP
ncbi:MAG: nuclear transport factor 2 family protein [Cyclobacteriaceae bacterium]|nr:nuclear transport factor 2 family protein [Cyclobacteriaceae bacterium]